MREKKVSRIDELIVAELLAEHPDVRAAIATTKGTKHADPIVEKDLIAIAGVLTNHPNFVPSPYGGSIIRHERFTEAVIPGKMISGGIGDDEAFVNLLKLPDGRWILLEVSMGPR